MASDYAHDFRITEEAIEANIKGEAYINVGEALVALGAGCNDSHKLITICVLTLRNGFTVMGKSTAGNPKVYREDMGQRAARAEAVRQIMPLMYYELRSQLERTKDCGDELGEALTRMVAHRLGNPDSFRPQDVDQILCQFPQDKQEEGGTEDNFAVEHVTATEITKNENPFG